MFGIIPIPAFPVVWLYHFQVISLTDRQIENVVPLLIIEVTLKVPLWSSILLDHVNRSTEFGYIFSI